MLRSHKSMMNFSEQPSTVTNGIAPNITHPSTHEHPKPSPTIPTAFYRCKTQFDTVLRQEFAEDGVECD